MQKLCCVHTIQQSSASLDYLSQAYQPVSPSILSHFQWELYHPVNLGCDWLQNLEHDHNHHDACNLHIINNPAIAHQGEQTMMPATKTPSRPTAVPTPNLSPSDEPIIAPPTPMLPTPQVPPERPPNTSPELSAAPPESPLPASPDPIVPCHSG